MKRAIWFWILTCLAAAPAIAHASPPSNTRPSAGHVAPGLPYRPAPVHVGVTAITDALPPIQELFLSSRVRPAPDGMALSARVAATVSPFSLAQFRPSDHSAFQRIHPLLTPDTPVNLNTLHSVKPDVPKRSPER